MTDEDVVIEVEEQESEHLVSSSIHKLSTRDGAIGEEIYKNDPYFPSVDRFRFYKMRETYPFAARTAAGSAAVSVTPISLSRWFCPLAAMLMISDSQVVAIYIAIFVIPYVFSVLDHFLDIINPFAAH